MPRQLVAHDLEAGDLVELQLEPYPHTDWWLGVDLLWRKAGGLGEAAAWLKGCLLERNLWEEAATPVRSRSRALAR